MKYKQIPIVSNAIVLLRYTKKNSFEFILQIFLSFHRWLNESKLGIKTRFHTFDKCVFSFSDDNELSPSSVSSSSFCFGRNIFIFGKASSTVPSPFC